MAIDNGVGEKIAQEWPVQLTFNERGELCESVAPVGSWPKGTLAKIATGGAAMLRKTVSSVRTTPHKLQQAPPPEIYFLDVGKWGDGIDKNAVQRNFALIWGKWVVLCDFLPGIPGQAPKSIDQGAWIDGFLRCLCSANTSVKVIKSLYCQQAHNVNWRWMYLLLGDLHLPVVRGKPKTSEKTEYETKIVGGIETWVAKKFSYVDDGEPCMGRYQYYRRDPNTVAWFNAYTYGDIFGQAGKDLVRFCELVNAFPAADKVHFVQLGDMYDLWIGLERCFEECEIPAVMLRGGVIEDVMNREKYTADQFISHWIAKTHKANADVTQALSALRVGGKTWLSGNHDNYLAPEACPSTIRKAIGTRRKEFQAPGIFMEHGHSADDSNRDGATSGHSVTNQVFTVPMLRAADPNRRQIWTINSTLQWIKADFKFNIYAMAHTHSPTLMKIFPDIALLTHEKTYTLTDKGVIVEQAFREKPKPRREIKY